MRHSSRKSLFFLMLGIRVGPLVFCICSHFRPVELSPFDSRTTVPVGGGQRWCRGEPMAASHLPGLLVKNPPVLS